MTVLRFIKTPDRFASGETAYSGAIPVGSYAWDALRPRGADADLPYVWALHLPGGERRGRAASPEIARGAVSAAFAEWCRVAGLGAVI